jgi:hypothetical protein
MTARERTAASRRRLIPALVVAGAALGLWGYFSYTSAGSETADYWNAVHALTREADAVKHGETIDEAIAVLDETTRKLLALDTADVDQTAVDAAIRFQNALDAARRSAEQAKWMETHWIRTALSGLTGAGHVETLTLRLKDLRAKSIEAHTFSSRAHELLCARYPRQSFASPYPPDVQPIDEALQMLNLGGDEEVVKNWFDIGVIIGAIARLLVGA